MNVSRKQGGIKVKFDNSKILLGILICLIIIALKSPPEYPAYQPSHFPSSLDIYDGERVVSMGENKIAIVDTDISSDTYGEVIVLEYNETSGEFDLIGKDNYLEDFPNR
ncbi:hypothetical protein [Paucisalibacillus sp. EB02]|uniref:hypothetical protein n=1 Tax=Paucisalibacillus sp. EB02 TaxID=1347087 RepID=UPI0004BAFBA0|nr:hypothetical protein [Paucisalibacillus sp. EB02]